MNNVDELKTYHYILTLKIYEHDCLMSKPISIDCRTIVNDKPFVKEMLKDGVERLLTELDIKFEE